MLNIGEDDGTGILCTESTNGNSLVVSFEHRVISLLGPKELGTSTETWISSVSIRKNSESDIENESWKIREESHKRDGPIEVDPVSGSPETGWWAILSAPPYIPVSTSLCWNQRLEPPPCVRSKVGATSTQICFSLNWFKLLCPVWPWPPDLPASSTQKLGLKVCAPPWAGLYGYSVASSSLWFLGKLCQNTNKILHNNLQRELY